MRVRRSSVAFFFASACWIACNGTGAPSDASGTGGYGGHGSGGAAAGGAPGHGGASSASGSAAPASGASTTSASTTTSNTTTSGTTTSSTTSTGTAGDTTTTAAATGAGGTTGAGGEGAGDALLHADFERTAPGPYTEDEVAADFGGAPPWNDGLDEGRASIVEEGGNRFLRVTYTANRYGPGDGGVQFKVPLGGTYEQLYLAYRVRFSAGFDFVKGGKLPGLVGGSAPTGCVDDTAGFSARMMWRTGGAAVQYVYFPEKKNACGDDYAYMTGRTAVRFEPGTWHTVEHRLVMNTPGEHDGVLQAWFDGAPVLDESAFLFRLAGATYGIDTLYFSTFFGGSDDTWAPAAAQVADFDDFIVTTAPITH